MSDNKDEVRNSIIADMEAKDQAASDAGIETPFQMEDMEIEQVTDSPTTSPKDEATDQDKEKTEPEGGKPTDEQHQQPRDSQGKFTKPESQPEPVPGAKESDYTKAQRGRERLDDIRKQAESDKAAARQEREATERLRAEFRQEIAQSRSQPQQSDAGRFSAEEFERAGDWYEAEAEKAALAGDLDEFQKSVGKAREVRRAAQITYQKQRESIEQGQREEFVKAYSGTVEQVIKDNPDLGNPDTEMSKSMVKLLEEQPVLTMHPEGFKWAYEILQMRESHGKVTGLSEENKQLLAENERLNKLVSPESGGPAPLERSDNFDNLPREKQREELRKQAEKADAF